MNALFPVGFMLIPAGMSLAVIAFGGMIMGLSAKDSVISLVLAAAPCAVAYFGFVTGRNTNAFSAAPLRSPWRALFVAVLGAACAILSLPIGLLLLNQLQGRGAWQAVLVALWFMISGMVLGHFYGPAFRRLARVFPRLKERDVQHRVG